MAASALPLSPFRRGKVRDVYAVDDARLLIVATDRVSAFDVVMGDTIPQKGAVLTQLTAWWLRQLEPAVQHHMLTADTAAIVRAIPTLKDHEHELVDRAMLCRRSTVFPIECVVRGYLSGSAWKEYRERGTLAGERLPPDLRESDRLVPPLFSPARKAYEGHDENITFAGMSAEIGERWANELAEKSLEIYEAGRLVAARRGIIIADTKFEFGLASNDATGPPGPSPGTVILVDEVLTPDSSRFWPAEKYKPGFPQPSFDKQPLRDYLDGERRAGRWDGSYPPPKLPSEVIDATSARYLDIYQRLTGSPLRTDEIK
jgi:phosphoribosylaminoimidazole-succinocarboxamide synthase